MRLTCLPVDRSGALGHVIDPVPGPLACFRASGSRHRIHDAGTPDRVSMRRTNSINRPQQHSPPPPDARAGQGTAPRRSRSSHRSASARSGKHSRSVSSSTPHSIAVYSKGATTAAGALPLCEPPAGGHRALGRNLIRAGALPAQYPVPRRHDAPRERAAGSDGKARSAGAAAAGPPALNPKVRGVWADR